MTFIVSIFSNTIHTLLLSRQIAVGKQVVSKLGSLLSKASD